MRMLLIVFMLALSFSPTLAADATSFDPTPIPVASQGISSIPVGTVIAWPSSIMPRATNGVIPSQSACLTVANADQADAAGCEWLEADGSHINGAAYPELVALVGGSLPDFRGIFLRGRGGNAAPLGQVQGDAMRNFTGRVWGAWGGHLNADGAFLHEQTIGINVVAEKWGNWNSPIYRFDPSVMVPTANENRPINRSVVYLIRAR